MKMKSILSLSFVLIFFFAGCGDQLDLSQFQANQGGGTIGDTTYIPISPAFEGFNNPQDVHIGHDIFVYVADTDNDRVVMMNLNGTILGTIAVKKPVAITQDFQLNLIICAKLDTVISGTTTTLGSVFKVNLVKANHNLSAASLERVYPTPGFSLTPQDLRVEYTGIASFFDNSFIVARKGPANSNFSAPDNAMLQFIKTKDGSKRDSLLGIVPDITPTGTGLLSANGISALSPSNNRNRDLFMAFTGSTSFKGQWLTYVVTNLGEGYQNRLSIGTDMMIPNRFDKPEDITVDESGNIYIVDAQKDSVYRFNSDGDQLQAFGGRSLFNGPSGVAFHDRIIYIADSKNNRVVRFQLSTDIR